MHLEEGTIAALKAMAAAESRPSSEIISAALKIVLSLPPGARSVLYKLLGTATEDEWAFALESTGLSAVKAYEAIIDGYNRASGIP